MDTAAMLTASHVEWIESFTCCHVLILEPYLTTTAHTLEPHHIFFYWKIGLTAVVDKTTYALLVVDTKECRIIFWKY